MSIIYRDSAPFAAARRYGRDARCTARGCGGQIARHSLGCGMATRRCTRCFRRYDVTIQEEAAPRRDGLRAIVHEFVSWREED